MAFGSNLSHIHTISNFQNNCDKYYDHSEYRNKIRCFLIYPYICGKLLPAKFLQESFALLQIRTYSAVCHRFPNFSNCRIQIKVHEDEMISYEMINVAYEPGLYRMGLGVRNFTGWIGTSFSFGINSLLNNAPFFYFLYALG